MVVHILLLILKTAGIVLLVLLGLVLLLTLLLLGASLKYRAEAEGKDTLESIRAKGQFSWLFHLVSGRVSYQDEKLEWKIRIAWKTMGDSSAGTDEGEEPVEEEEEKPVPAARESREESAPETPEVQESREGAAPETPEVQESPGKPAVPENSMGTVENSGEPAEEAGGGEKERKKPGPLARFRKKWNAFVQAVGNFFRNIKYTFQKICDKINALEKRKDRLQRFIENETHRQAFGKLRDEGVWLWKRIRPRKLDIRLHFGLEDPYHTGKVLAVLAVLYPFLEGGLDVTPDFEEKVLEGRIFVQGRMRAVHFLLPALKLLGDRRVRVTYRRIRQMWQSMS